MPNQAEAAPVRGLLLIGVAVLIGALFLSKGFDNGGAAAVSGGDVPTADSVPSGVGTGTDTTGETIPGAGSGTVTTQVPTDQLPVLVVNASGVSGAATTVTTELRNAGYAAAIDPSGGAPTTTDVTLVYYFQDATSNFQGDATAVATTLQLQAATQVQPLPADLGVDIGVATVVVWLGTDKASQAG